MNNDKRYRLARNVTLIGAVFNAFLAGVKIFFGVIGHSGALFADGVHSLSDLLTDFMVILAAKLGAEDADESHPYGHRRIETAATVFLSLLLAIVGVAIIYDGGRELFIATYQPIKSMVVYIAMLSVALNEALYVYTYRVGREIKSDLIIANAWHHRSDAISSLVVLIGVSASMLGYHHFDSIAAILVGLMIVKMGWSLGFNSMMELIDSSVDKETVSQMRGLIIQTPGVVTLHQLRTRSMAGHILVDVHIIVDEKISVSEGHHIAQNVAIKLRSFVKDISDVTVHVDPEDDEIKNPCENLPSREKLLGLLEQRWQSLKGYALLEKTNLHYLDGKVCIECYFNSGKVDIEGFKKSIADNEMIRSIRFYQALS